MRTHFRTFAVNCAISLLVILCCGASTKADSSTTKKRLITKLAEGVYEIRHVDAPDAFPQGNTTVVIGYDAVLVVDSCYLPSSAREDIAQIREWTKKPVRFLLNTHWHYDHTMGNAEYVDAFPGIAVISQVETRNQIAGYNPQWFLKYPTRADLFRKVLESGKDFDGKPLSAADAESYKKSLAGVALVQPEFEKSAKRLGDLVPKVTFDHEMTLNLGNREVRFLHEGRGNTAGDAAVYLPVEKILITGDLLDSPIPYHFGGYPNENVETLEALDRLDVQTIVPGHGEILRDKTFFHLELEFLRTVTEEVRRAIYKEGAGSENFDKVREDVLKNLDAASFRIRFAGTDRNDGDFFDETLDGLIKAAFAESWGK
jgi:cyclase